MVGQGGGMGVGDGGRRGSKAGKGSFLLRENGSQCCGTLSEFTAKKSEVFLRRSGYVFN